MEQIRPIHDRVIVSRLAEDEISRGGLYIPDSARERPQIGRVVAVGPGRRTEHGNIIEPTVKVGDTVVFSKYAGTDDLRRYFQHDGEDVTIMREEEILAILETEPEPKAVAA